MCDCINEIKEATCKHVKKQVEENWNVHEWSEPGRFSHVGFSMSGGPSKIGMPFQVAYTRKKKNGEPEKRVTNEHVYIYPTFCPFCGEKYPETKG